ncbi:MAG: hypothetical protein R2825_08595 [Saprospiraceae bacterium]
MKNICLTLILAIILASSCKKDDDTSKKIMGPNFSFEGTPMESLSPNTSLPEGLFDCGFAGESSPDIHPVENGVFGVTQTPYDGETYLGMVVRANDTWERIGIELETPLTAGKVYDFSIYLSRSLNYRNSNSSVASNFATPCILRIWGGFSMCQREELLAKSEAVEHEAWKEYKFEITPTLKVSHIVLEAFYMTPTPFPYNGNILLDNASGFIER